MPVGKAFRFWPKREPPENRESNVAGLLKTELDETILKLQAFTQELRDAEEMAEDFLDKYDNSNDNRTGE